MPFSSVLLVVLAVVLAASISYYLYFYKGKVKGNLRYVLAGLRFLALLAVLLLLINPKYERRVYSAEKSNLILLADNSKSITSENDRKFISDLLDAIQDDESLNSRFRLNFFSFGEELNSADSLDYLDRSTNISKALDRIKQLYPGDAGALLLLSDGNQTLGEDYTFRGESGERPVFPVVLGDTTRYEDLRIDRVNINNYAFLGNQYPIEILVSYQGDNTIDTNLSVLVDGVTKYRRSINLSATSNTRELSVQLEAESTGLKQIEVRLSPIPGERNTANNSRILGLEVIDEQTRIALVSEIIHPDLRLFKESIETNEQRTAEVIAPNETEKFDQFNLFVIYQPNSRFQAVYQYVNSRNSPLITVAGPRTEWQFLNRAQSSFSGNRLGTSEEVLPILNNSFGLFDLDDFTVDGYPPLDVDLGDFLVIKPHEILLEQRIKGIDVNEPLVLIITEAESREAIILGEHLWKWRIQEFRNTQSFEAFDNLMGKLIRYLATAQSKERLTVDYEKNLQGTTSAVITARYFDEAFEFKPDATLTLFVTPVSGGDTREIPMLLKTRFFEADIGGLPAGEYTFSVSVNDTDLSRQGRFRVLEYDVEQQLQSSDLAKLSRLATNTEGDVFFPDNQSELLEELRENPRFTPILKSTQNVVSLIDFKILLAIIVAALAAEWFIRKYHGLI